MPFNQRKVSCYIWPILDDCENTVSRYGYLLEREPDDPHVTVLRDRRLYVFDWSDGTNPPPRYQIQLPPYTNVRVSQGQLQLWMQPQPSNKWDRRIQGRQLDPSHPELLLDKSNWVPDSNSFANDELSRNGHPVLAMDKRDDLYYVSDSLGLRILRRVKAHEWDLIGEYQASPLTLWFGRDVYQNQLLDGSLLLENGIRQITVYDVSDLSHPRRVGFFNAVKRYGDKVYAIPHFFLLREDNLLTVLQLPGNSHL